MTTTVLPLDASSGSPTYSAQATRQAFAALAGVAPSGRPLGATSGVRPGTPSTTASVTGFTWAIAAHAGVLDVQASAVAGPYLYATDGTDTGTVTAADGTNPRIDILYVQVNDNVQDSSGLESGLIGYLAGTAAATPVAPNAPARSMVLANINVPKNGAGNPSVSWVAPTFGVTTPSPWASYSPTWTAVGTNPTLGNGTLTGKFYEIGKLVHAKVTLTIGSSTNPGSGAFVFSLPSVVNASPQTSVGGGGIVYDANPTPTQYGCQAYLNSDSASVILTQNNNRVTATSPVTPANGDIISFSVFYEKA